MKEITTANSVDIFLDVIRSIKNNESVRAGLYEITKTGKDKYKIELRVNEKEFTDMVKYVVANEGYTKLRKQVESKAKGFKGV